MPTTAREVTRRLADDGRVLVGRRGSHCHFERRVKPGQVTVPGTGDRDLAPGTLKSILRRVGLEETR